MGNRKVRLIDCSAGALWLAAVWLMVRAGFGELNALHAWGLVAVGVALAMTMRAFTMAESDRVVEQIRKTMRELAIDDLLDPRRDPHHL